MRMKARPSSLHPLLPASTTRLLPILWTLMRSAASGHGWVDLDPTNDKMTTTEHVTLAWGRDYGDVSPVKGAIVGGGQHRVRVAVDVLPVAEDDAA